MRPLDESCKFGGKILQLCIESRYAIMRDMISHGFNVMRRADIYGGLL